MAAPILNPPRHARAVVLGASNVSRGISTIVESIRRTLGSNVEILVAAGHGRSYGIDSRVLARSVPSILDCGLWSWLASAPPVPSYALVCDVGNDILYGQPSATILAWVEACLSRIRQVSASVAIVGLPMDRLRRLSPIGFRVLSTLLYPTHRVTFEAAFAAAERVDRGLADLARDHGARLVVPSDGLYGLDPIHVRTRQAPAFWRDVLAAWRPDLAPADVPGRSLRRWIAIRSRLPQSCRILGVPIGGREAPPGEARFAGGTVVRLF
ncbi:MAG: hypothetical protein KDA22_10515 [Phycisphaerales bacterium]|nr:hypothetical protein [Phycisphaerales bacterium]